MRSDPIRIGTVVNGNEKTADVIRQIVPHGFESFSLAFLRTLGNCDLERLADDVRRVLDGTSAIVSSVCLYGNPLADDAQAGECRAGWEKLIDSTRLFGCDIVAGFTGRLAGKPIPDSIPRFAEVFGPLAKRAADKGVRIAFENCNCGGAWRQGGGNIALGPAAWELMFDALPADNIGLQWEPAHQMEALIDPLPQLRKWVKKIFLLHGKDATVMWDVIREHGIYGPHPFVFHRTPGFGDSNWTDIISELRRGGFEGSIDIEGYHDPVYRGELEMTGQVYGLEYLKRCRGGVRVPNPE